MFYPYILLKLSAVRVVYYFSSDAVTKYDRLGGWNKKIIFLLLGV